MPCMVWMPMYGRSSFCQATPCAYKFEFKYNSNLFYLFWHISVQFFNFFHNFLSLCIHFLAAGLRTESVLVIHPRSRLFSGLYATYGKGACRLWQSGGK